MKIAILASAHGEKALYLHDFFKEGNRITVNCLLTDDPASPVAESMRAEGIDVVYMSQPQMEELARMLKGREVELLVVDDFAGDVPPELREAFGDAIVFPTAKESAPLEVIEASRKIQFGETQRPEPEIAAQEGEGEEPGSENGEIEGEEKKESETPKTPEDEWAEVLEIDVEVPRPEGEGIPPKYDNPVPPSRQQPQYGPQQPYGQPPYPGQPQYPGYRPQGQAPYGRPAERQVPAEPMPDTYLLWSVLITIFCCLIPGIVAIVYSSTVSSKYYQGDLEGARRASRYAQIWCIVSVIAGVLWATLYLPLTLFLA